MNRVGHERNTLAVFFVHPISSAFAARNQKASGKICLAQKAIIIP
jgi:hypothetical protein